MRFICGLSGFLCERGQIPLNQRDYESYMELIFYDHSADYWDNKIYISYVSANMILELDCNSEKYDVICDEKTTMVYCATNTVTDGKLYFTRWDLSDSFKRVQNNFEECVKLEIGYYDIKTKEIKLLHSFMGTDDIHTTNLSKCGDYLFSLEMCQEPEISYPSDISNASNDTMLKILNAGLRKSHFYTYDIKNRKMLETKLMGASPAHIEFDLLDKRYFYVTQHNNSVVSGGVMSLGHAKINKIKFEKGIMVIENVYDGKDLFRTPSNRLTVRNNKQMILCPSYSCQAHIINVEDMTLNKKINLSKRQKEPDYSNGPALYPTFTSDRTAFTIHGIEESPFIYYVSIWNILLVDTDHEKQIGKVIFNVNGKPIVGLGHTTKIESKTRNY